MYIHQYKGKEGMDAVKACITTISKKKWERIKKLNKNYGWFNERYKPPKWCIYPDVLNVALGCLSISSWPWEISKKYCRDCGKNKENQ